MTANATPALSVELGAITRVQTDVIVNAANSALAGGGGVDGAIHAAGGPVILEECKELVQRMGECVPGSAVATSAGKLSARWVVHTVGPIWSLGDQTRHADTLARCYLSSLTLSAELGAATVAFPNISTGVYGFPKNRAAPIAVSSVIEWLSCQKAPARIQSVRFVCFDTENFDLCQAALTSNL